MKCKYCDGEIKIEEQIFINGTKHLRRTCTVCKKYNGYAPQETDPLKFKMPFGKYINKSLEDIYQSHPDYLRWAGENCNKNIQNKIEKFLDIKFKERLDENKTD